MTPELDKAFKQVRRAMQNMYPAAHQDYEQLILIEQALKEALDGKVTTEPKGEKVAVCIKCRTPTREHRDPTYSAKGYEWCDNCGPVHQVDTGLAYLQEKEES